jgi:NAD-dependent dihydropyrimidine dehydrogenase PreA subunit
MDMDEFIKLNDSPRTCAICNDDCHHIREKLNIELADAKKVITELREKLLTAREDAIEECAKMCEEYWGAWFSPNEIWQQNADKLRELKMDNYPGRRRGAISQDEHEKINERHYPGTRQICIYCGQPTERCEEDEIRNESGDGPLCVECFDEH